MSYAKLKDGSIVKIWSDNEDEKTINYYPAHEEFYPYSTITSECPYSDILSRYSTLLELSEEDYNGVINNIRIKNHLLDDHHDFRIY